MNDSDIFSLLLSFIYKTKLMVKSGIIIFGIVSSQVTRELKFEFDAVDQWCQSNMSKKVRYKS